MITQTLDITLSLLPLRIEVTVAHRSDDWLLLTHGLQGDKSLFDSWFEDPRFRKYSLLAMDLVGFGGSSKPREFSYDLRDQARVIIQILKVLHISSFTIVGHSVGGMIAPMLLTMTGLNIKGIVSLEGNLTLADCGMSTTWATMDEADIHAKNSTPGFALQRTSASLMKYAQQGALLTTFTHAMQPRLLVIGAKSYFTSRPMSPGLTTKIIPDAGHFMLSEQPQLTKEAVADFLRKEHL